DDGEQQAEDDQRDPLPLLSDACHRALEPGGYSRSRSTSPPSASSASRVWPPSSRKRAMRRRAAAVGSEWLKQSASSRRPSTVGSSAAFTARLASAIASAGKDAIRKSTRLNSSHVSISYAVFCLKKKNNSWTMTS